MATTFALDPLTGDLARTGGRCSLISDGEQVAQRIATALRLHRGEDRYDVDNGFPWLEEVLGAKVPPQAVEARLRAYCLTVPGVTSVDSVTLTRDKAKRTGEILIRFNGESVLSVAL